MLANSILEEKAHGEFQTYCMEYLVQYAISPTNGMALKLEEIDRVAESPEHVYKVYFEANNTRRKFSNNYITHILL